MGQNTYRPETPRMEQGLHLGTMTGAGSWGSEFD
jgi:hypothetical protein